MQYSYEKQLVIAIQALVHCWLLFQIISLNVMESTHLCQIILCAISHKRVLNNTFICKHVTMAQCFKYGRNLVNLIKEVKRHQTLVNRLTIIP